VFLDHLGIASMNIGYGGEDDGGEYHSIYDSFDNFNRFKDPGNIYGVVLAKTTGNTVLRLANAQILPFDFTVLSTKINGYITEVKDLVNTLKTQSESFNKNIDNDVYYLASDPKKHFVKPAFKGTVPFLNFAPLENASEKLNISTKNLQKIISEQAINTANFENLNDLLYKAERLLISSKGLPRRPWFKNQIYAPGFYTGYGVKTLPGVREAIEQKNWIEVQEQIGILSETLNNFSDYLDKIAVLKN